MNRKKLAQFAGISAVVLAALGAGAYGYRRYTRARAMEPVLPAFTEPDAGPKAPSSEGFGFAVGRVTVTEAEAKLKALGLDCKDTSIRVLMRGMRERKLAEIEEKKARGEDVDAVSGASMTRPSPRERNPQVRLSCEDTQPDLLPDRKRLSPAGRLLLVFDSPDHPLRHISYRRSHTDHAKALADINDTIDALKKTFGEPTKSTGELPSPSADGSVELPRLTPYSREWEHSDIHVKVEAMNFGRRGVSVSEIIEVPWPVRSDAPTLPGAPPK